MGLHSLVFGGCAFLPFSLGPAGDCPCKDEAPPAIPWKHPDWHWHAGGWNALDHNLAKPCEALRGGRESIYHRERTCADEGATRGRRWVPLPGGMRAAR